MVAPRLLTPKQIIIKSGTYIVIESLAGATLTCGSQTYTLGSGETFHAFEVTAGTYACTANLSGYYEASSSVTITTGFEYVKLNPTLVPLTYQQVEYLHSDGNQYIVTNVTNGANQIINCKFLIDSDRTNRIFCTGNYESQFIYSVGTNKIFVAKNNASASTEHTTPAIYPNTVYDVTLDASTKLIINGTEYNNCVDYGGATTQNAYCLFRRITDSSNIGTIGRIYSFNVLQDNSKVIDLVPCYRKSDSVVGMYDKVSNTFLANSGSGNFTVGADVN